MSPEEFGHRLDTVHQRVSELTGGAGPSEENVENLRAALEELRVADEEMRQQNEELLAAHLQVESEHRRYQELFELAPDAYIVTDLAGLVSEANKSACRLFGIAAPFLTGKSLASCIASEDRARFRSVLGATSRTSGTHASPFKLSTRTGDPLYAELNYSIVHGDHGEPIGFRWLIRDVTERERMAQQIRTLNAELESRVAERTTDLQTAQQLSEDLL